MRFLTTIILAHLIFNGLGQSKQLQLIGTHVFLDMPATFSHSFDPSGYVDSLAGIYISAFRAPESIKVVRSQFSDQKLYKSADLIDSKHLVVQTEMSSAGQIFTNFMIPIGDKKESAVVTIITTNIEESASTIESLINSIKWIAKSDLNFEKEYFFEVEGLEDFEPLFKMNNDFTFAPKEASFPRPEFTLRIGTNIMPSDYSGKERQIVEYLVNPDNEPFFSKSKEFQDRLIDGHNSTTIKWIYEQNGKITKRYLTSIFTNGRLYFIEAKSISSEFDYLLNKFDNIVSTFKIKL